MKKSRLIVTRNASELAKALGLSPADGAEIELRSVLKSKIIEAVRRKNLTHAQVAGLARTSRTRIKPQHQSRLYRSLTPRPLLPRLHRQNHLQNRRLTQIDNVLCRGG